MYMGRSLVVVTLSVSDVIGCVDREIGGINVVAFHGSLKQLRVVDNSRFLEVQLLVLDQ